MIPFRKIKLEDAEWIRPILKQSDFRGSEYSFANNFNWREIYNIQVAQMNGFYQLRWGPDTKPAYLFPAGEGDLADQVQALVDDAAERGYPFELQSLTEEGCKRLEAAMPGQFAFHATRNSFDYLYETQRLQTLAGKKLHAKRNHINRFLENNPGWVYEEITAENHVECMKMSREWCENLGEISEDLEKELCSVQSALSHLEQLNLKGGLIRVDGRIIAFSVGEPLNSDTFIVHIEKAFAEIQGAYPMINQQFVLHHCEGYQYVNREDDAGDEGLRRAKTSYDPILLEKWTAKLK